MKKTILLLSLFMALVSCNDDNAVEMESNAIGKWRIIDFYSDPGDGNSISQPATDKTIEFTDQGVVNSNMGICFGDDLASGIFNINDRTITTENCSTTYTFEGRFLKIYQPCLESCFERFVRND